MAAGYAKSNHAVEFIEEGTEKTPDLLVSPVNGRPFFVECKRRDALTERDRKLNAVWKELESRLLRLMGPQRLNYLVVIRAKVDPKMDDLDYMYQKIVKSFLTGGLGRMDASTRTVTPMDDEDGRFQFAVTKLAEADQMLESRQVEIKTVDEFDRVIIGFEQKNDGDKSFIRNPVIILLKTEAPPDRVTGIVDAFKTATRQLPEGGPGVVWIRVADSSWRRELGESFSRARRLIAEQLTGDWNRRVNAVFIMTRTFRSLEDNGLSGLAYSPLIDGIEHANPATPISLVP